LTLKFIIPSNVLYHQKLRMPNDSAESKTYSSSKRD